MSDQKRRYHEQHGSLKRTKPILLNLGLIKLALFVGGFQDVVSNSTQIKPPSLTAGHCEQ